MKAKEAYALSAQLSYALDTIDRLGQLVYTGMFDEHGGSSFDAREAAAETLDGLLANEVLQARAAAEKLEKFLQGLAALKGVEDAMSTEKGGES